MRILHMADPSNTTLQISTDPAFGTLALNEETEYKTSRAFTKGELPYGVNLYARTKHTHPETGASNWSNTVQFKIIMPYNTVGVCYDRSSKTWSWIDELGNKMSSFDWQSHPTFDGITMVTEDASRSPVTMTRFPLFYVKTATSGPVGTFSNGKKCWWISDQSAPGFRPHPTFKRSTQQVNGKYKISPYVDIMTFLGFEESVGGKTTIGSKRGTTVRGYTSLNDLRTFAQNRNNVSAGQTGWRVMDVWDWSMLRFLHLIAKANGDSQASWGDNSSATSYPNAGSTNARMVFKGTHSDPRVSIEDLWRTYYQPTDLATITSGGYQTYTSPMNSTSVAYTVSKRYEYASRWYDDFVSASFTLGDDTHDLLEVFHPTDAGASSEADAIIKDQNIVDYDVGDIPLMGGSWHYGSDAGLWFLRWYFSASYSSSNSAGRFAKN